MAFRICIGKFQISFGKKGKGKDCAPPINRTKKSFKLFSELYSKNFYDLVDSHPLKRYAPESVYRIAFLFYLFICEMTDYVSIETATIDKSIFFDIAKIKRNKKKIRESIASRIEYLYSIIDKDPSLEFLKIYDEKILDLKVLELIQDSLFNEINDVIPIHIIGNSIISVLGYV